MISYKYRLKGKRVVRILGRHSRAVNYVWNYCVALQKETQRRWQRGDSTRWSSQYDLQGLTKGTSKDLGLHAQTVQGVCEQFVKSRNQHRRCPDFRASGGSKRALGWVPFPDQARKLDGNSITYLGQTFRWFGFKKRPLPANVKGGAFVEDARGRWYVTLHVETEDCRPLGEGVVGVDLGLKHLATLSTGEKIENPRSYKKLEVKLATAQRAGKKQRVRAIHAKIKNTRSDHLHKVSAKLAKLNKIIIVGDVSSQRLAKGRMAKSVLDASWGLFKGMLRYKASRHGACYKEVDERFTTRVCSSCGAIPDSSPKGMGGLGIRSWRCDDCGATHDRDVNAARNILRIGLGAQPPGEGSRVVLTDVK